MPLPFFIRSGRTRQALRTRVLKRNKVNITAPANRSGGQHRPSLPRIGLVRTLWMIRSHVEWRTPRSQRVAIKRRRTIGVAPAPRAIAPRWT